MFAGSVRYLRSHDSNVRRCTIVRARWPGLSSRRPASNTAHKAPSVPSYGKWYPDTREPTQNSGPAQSHVSVAQRRQPHSPLIAPLFLRCTLSAPPATMWWPHPAVCQTSLPTRATRRVYPALRKPQGPACSAPLPFSKLAPAPVPGYLRLPRSPHST